MNELKPYAQLYANYLVPITIKLGMEFHIVDLRNLLLSRVYNPLTRACVNIEATDNTWAPAVNKFLNLIKTLSDIHRSVENHKATFFSDVPTIDAFVLLTGKEIIEDFLGYLSQGKIRFKNINVPDDAEGISLQPSELQKLIKDLTVVSQEFMKIPVSKKLQMTFTESQADSGNRPFIFEGESTNKKSVQAILKELLVAYEGVMSNYRSFQKTVEHAYNNQSPPQKETDHGNEYHIQQADFEECVLERDIFMESFKVWDKLYGHYCHRYGLSVTDQSQLKAECSRYAEEILDAKSNIDRELSNDLVSPTLRFVYDFPNPNDRAVIASFRVSNTV